jgi:hypothetical protein
MKLPSGQPPRLDWYGHNPYPFRFPDLRKSPIHGGWRDLSDPDTLAAEVDRAYRSRGQEPRLWLSEFTVQLGPHPVGLRGVRQPGVAGAVADGRY